jgi:hypothetical protein
MNPLAAAVVLTLQILVTNDARISPRVLCAAEQTTERLFGDIGVRIEWIDHVDHDLPMVVAFPPDGGAERLQVGVAAMGYTFRTEEPNPGGRALVFYDRIERRAQTSGTEVTRLLGAVMAHEIGHMLIANAHTQTGLMRGVWNDRDLHLINMEFLRFTSLEQRRMQQDLFGLRLTSARPAPAGGAACHAGGDN